MKRPLVGITPLWDENYECPWMLPDYEKALESVGICPVVLPMTEDPEEIAELAEQLDGFLFTGGPDVNPKIYGAERLEACGPACEVRDVLEGSLLMEAMARKKPILGICRGIQFINACLGGTLYQDLPTEHPSDVPHRMTPPYDQEIHTVEILEGTPLSQYVDETNYGVNTRHHQAVRELAPILRPMAVAPDGIVEGAWAEEYPFLWAVQWHPEYTYEHALSHAVFQAFADALTKEKEK